MAYQSKTWSLSDEVVAEIERRVREMAQRTGSGSPNRVLRDVLGIDGEKLVKPGFQNGSTPLDFTITRDPNGCVECGSIGGHKMSCERGNQLAVQRQGFENYPPAHLDATGPELPSGKGKATVETRGIRPKGDSKR